LLLNGIIVNTQFSPHSKYTAPPLQNAIIYCCIGKESLLFENAAEHRDALCGQNVEFLILNLVAYKATPELSGSIRIAAM
jgi:hypothetical protein